jgi:hypothetical protein
MVARETRQARRGQILAVCLGLGLALGFMAIYFLGWLLGIAVVCLGWGSLLIFIAATLDRR